MGDVPDNESLRPLLRDAGGPDGLRVESHAAIAALPDRVTAWLEGLGELYTSPEWLASVERDFESVTYVVVDEPAAPRGPLGMGCLYRGGPDAYRYYNPAKLLDAEGPTAEELSPFALSAIPFGYRDGFVVDPALAGERRRRVQRCLVECLAIAGRAWGTALEAVLYVDGRADAGLGEMLAGEGWVRQELEAEVELTVPGADFEDYLGTLRRNRRTSIRRERRALHEAGVDVTHHGIEGLDGTLVELQKRIDDRHGLGLPAAFYEELFGTIRRHFGSISRVIRFDGGGEPLGFSLLYDYGGTLYVKMVGHAEARESFVYFNALVYEPLQLAYRLGRRRLVLGPEAYKGKVSRGASLSPRTGYFRLPPGPARAAVKQLAAARTEAQRVKLAPFVGNAA